MAWTVETAENLAQTLLTTNPDRGFVACHEDALTALVHLREAGLLVSDNCGTTATEFGYQVRLGAGKWSQAFRTGRDPSEAAKLGSRYVAESRAAQRVTYRVVSRVVHQGLWREVHE
jgi:hypothetical protein